MPTIHNASPIPAAPHWIKRVRVDGKTHVIDTTKTSVYHYFVALGGQRYADKVLRELEIESWTPYLNTITPNGKAGK